MLRPYGYDDDPMNVVGHHNKAIQVNMWDMLRNGKPGFLCSRAKVA